MNSVTWEWWVWVLLGLVLLLGELLTPGGFYLIFFGTGALIVGVLTVFLQPTLAWQGLFFVVLSTASLLLFRRPLLQRFRRLTPETQVDLIEGEEAVALDDIPPQGVGRAELRGTPWSAENLGSAAIPARSRCRVERVEGLRLYIRAL